MDAAGAAPGRDDQALGRTATVCSSTLVSAFDSNCGPATTIYGLGLIGIVGGVVPVIIGIIQPGAQA